MDGEKGVCLCVLHSAVAFALILRKQKHLRKKLNLYFRCLQREFG